VDKKNNKYFTLDQEEEEYDRRRQKEKNVPENSNTYYRHSRNTGVPERENERSNSRLN